MIVHSANANGIVTANERPNTANRISNAIGIAIPSPFFKSWLKIGSRSCWIGPAPVT